jgi:hypothetical protein
MGKMNSQGPSENAAASGAAVTADASPYKDMHPAYTAITLSCSSMVEFAGITEQCWMMTPGHENRHVHRSLTSGKQPHNYGKSPCLVGKSW